MVGVAVAGGENFARPRTSSFASFSKSLFSRNNSGLSPLNRRSLLSLGSNRSSTRAKTNWGRTAAMFTTSADDMPGSRDNSPAAEPWRAHAATVDSTVSSPVNSPRASPCQHHCDDSGVLNLLADRVGNMQIAMALLRIARAGDACTARQSMRICPHYYPPHEGEIYPECANKSEAFYGEKRPKISLERYLARLVRYIDVLDESEEMVAFPGMGLTSVLGAVVLLDRLKHKHPTQVHLDEMNSHRMFMIATLVAFKFMADDCCSNEYYAGVAGVPLQDINRMEIEFMVLLGFEAALSARDFGGVWSQFCDEEMVLYLYHSVRY
ncbi:hypothetical protein BASA81_005438 [Batrachochytrium salamandrivorans]|nr:hypothetical protein BASA81_005438 [Batrachochytrium salamandrivorans]